MDAFTVMLVVLVVLFVGGIVVAAALRPRGSQGAPGEVTGDRPLSRATPAEWEDREHRGPAEDRPGGPAAEPMDPDALASPEVEGRGNGER